MRHEVFGPVLITYINNIQPKAIESLSEYNRRKMNISVNDKELITKSTFETGRIEGYLQCLRDIDIISEREKANLYNHYSLSKY